MTKRKTFNQKKRVTRNRKRKNRKFTRKKKGGKPLSTKETVAGKIYIKNKDNNQVSKAHVVTLSTEGDNHDKWKSDNDDLLVKCIKNETETSFKIINPREEVQEDYELGIVLGGQSNFETSSDYLIDTDKNEKMLQIFKIEKTDNPITTSTDRIHLENIIDQFQEGSLLEAMYKMIKNPPSVTMSQEETQVILQNIETEISRGIVGKPEIMGPLRNLITIVSESFSDECLDKIHQTLPEKQKVIVDYIIGTKNGSHTGGADKMVSNENFVSDSREDIHLNNKYLLEIQKMCDESPSERNNFEFIKDYLSPHNLEKRGQIDLVRDFRKSLVSENEYLGRLIDIFTDGKVDREHISNFNSKLSSQSGGAAAAAAAAPPAPPAAGAAAKKKTDVKDLYHMNEHTYNTTKNLYQKETLLNKEFYCYKHSDISILDALSHDARLQNGIIHNTDGYPANKTNIKSLLSHYVSQDIRSPIVEKLLHEKNYIFGSFPTEIQKKIEDVAYKSNMLDIEVLNEMLTADGETNKVWGEFLQKKENVKDNYRDEEKTLALEHFEQVTKISKKLKDKYTILKTVCNAIYERDPDQADNDFAAAAGAAAGAAGVLTEAVAEAAAEAAAAATAGEAEPTFGKICIKKLNSNIEAMTTYLQNIITVISSVDSNDLININNARANIKNHSYGKAVKIDPLVSVLLKPKHPQIIVVLNSVGVVLPKSQIPNPYPDGNYQTCYLLQDGEKFYLSKTMETININEHITVIQSEEEKEEQTKEEIPKYLILLFEIYAFFINGDTTKGIYNSVLITEDYKNFINEKIKKYNSLDKDKYEDYLCKNDKKNISYHGKNITYCNKVATAAKEAIKTILKIRVSLEKSFLGRWTGLGTSKFKMNNHSETINYRDLLQVRSDVDTFIRFWEIIKDNTISADNRERFLDEIVSLQNWYNRYLLVPVEHKKEGIKELNQEFKDLKDPSCLLEKKDKERQLRIILKEMKNIDLGANKDYYDREWKRIIPTFKNMGDFGTKEKRDKLNKVLNQEKGKINDVIVTESLTKEHIEQELEPLQKNQIFEMISSRFTSLEKIPTTITDNNTIKKILISIVLCLALGYGYNSSIIKSGLSFSVTKIFRNKILIVCLIVLSSLRKYIKDWNDVDKILNSIKSPSEILNKIGNMLPNLSRIWDRTSSGTSSETSSGTSSGTSSRTSESSSPIRVRRLTSRGERKIHPNKLLL